MSYWIKNFRILDLRSKHPRVQTGSETHKFLCTNWLWDRKKPHVQTGSETHNFLCPDRLWDPQILMYSLDLRSKHPRVQTGSETHKFLCIDWLWDQKTSCPDWFWNSQLLMSRLALRPTTSYVQTGSEIHKFLRTDWIWDPHSLKFRLDVRPTNKEKHMNLIAIAVRNVNTSQGCLPLHSISY